jgi:hypothetical protein
MRAMDWQEAGAVAQVKDAAASGWWSRSSGRAPA